MLVNIGKFYLTIGNFTDAEKYSDWAHEIYSQQLKKYGADNFQNALYSDEDGLFLHMAVKLGKDAASFREEALEFAQMQSDILAAKAFNISTLIRSEKNSKIRNLFYDYRDKTDQLKELDTKIEKLLISNEDINKTLLSGMVDKQVTVEKELKDLNEKLASLSPVFKDLYNIKPLLIKVFKICYLTKRH